MVREAGTMGDGKLSMPPMDYFRPQVYGCFWFENNFPHPTCLYPDPLSQAPGVFADLTVEERRKVLSLNAAKVYNIPLA